MTNENILYLVDHHYGKLTLSKLHIKKETELMLILEHYEHLIGGRYLGERLRKSRITTFKTLRESLNYIAARSEKDLRDERVNLDKLSNRNEQIKKSVALEKDDAALSLLKSYSEDWK